MENEEPLFVLSLSQLNEVAVVFALKVNFELLIYFRDRKDK
jgi:hypothetical protein